MKAPRSRFKGLFNRVMLFGVIGLVTELVIAWPGVYFFEILGRFGLWSGWRRVDWCIRAPLASGSPAQALTVSRASAFARVSVAVLASVEVPTYGQPPKRIIGDGYAAWPVTGMWDGGGTDLPLGAMAGPWSLRFVAPATVDPKEWPERPGPITPVCSNTLFQGQANGWPLVCFGWTARYDPDVPGGRGFHVSGRLEIPAIHPPGRLDFPVELPYLPMWWRLAADAALLGGAWCLLSHVPGAIRCARSWCRGSACLKCGYELSGIAAEFCPECGGPVPAGLKRRDGMIAGGPKAGVSPHRSGSLRLWLALSVGVGALWWASARSYANVWLTPLVAVGIQGGNVQVLCHAEHPFGARWWDAGVSPDYVGLDWLGGAESEPGLFSFSVPLWMPLVLTLVLSGMRLRRVRRRL